MKYYKQLFRRHLSSNSEVDRTKLSHCAQKITHHLLRSYSKFCAHLKENAQKKVHLKRYAPFLCLSLSLTGCMGIYEGGFECPAGTGVGCKSISDVNTLVNLGAIPKVQAEELSVSKPEIWYASQIREQWSGIRNQKKSSTNSSNSCPSNIEEQIKEKKKGVQPFDATSI